MSGVEIVGLAASVLQIADYGWKTSYKLYAFSKKVHDAGKTIELISQDIGATGAVLKQLGDEVGKDEKAKPGSRLCSQGLIDTASKLVEECSDLFKEIDLSIGGKDGNKVVLGFKQKLKWSYLEPRVELLRANLERLKSSLALMLNVLVYAEQVRSREERAVLLDTQTLVASFAAQNANAEKQIIQWRERIKNSPAASRDSEVTTTVSNSLAVFRTLSRKQNLSARPQANLERGIPTNSVADDMPQAFQVNAVDTTAVAQSVTSCADGQEPQQENVSDRCHDESEEVRMSSPLLLNLEHQRALIEKLLEEVNSSRYAIDHGARYRIHDGVLNLHWLEWSSMREVHGDELLRGLLSQSPILARHWHERLSVAQESASAGHHLAESDIAGVGFSEPPRAKTNFQEPTLTPISERNYWSTRNSVVSLQIPGGIPSMPPIPNPGIAQLREVGSPSYDENLSLSSLMRLRVRTFGGSSSHYDQFDTLHDSSSLTEEDSGPVESVSYVRDANDDEPKHYNLEERFPQRYRKVKVVHDRFDDVDHHPRVESPSPPRSKRDSGKYYMSGARINDIPDRRPQEYERRRPVSDPEVQRLREDMEKLKLERRGAELAVSAAKSKAERLKADLEYEKRQRSLEKRERDIAQRKEVLSRQRDQLREARPPRERQEIVVVQARESNRSALDRAGDDYLRPRGEAVVVIRERESENWECSTAPATIEASEINVAITSTHTEREKSRSNLLKNPMNLRARRRLSQNQENLEDVDLMKIQLHPSIAVDSDSRIRGNSVYDFSAPRARGTKLSSDNLDQEASQPTSISEIIEPLNDPVTFIKGLDTSVPAATIANSLLTQWTTVSPPPTT